MAEIPSCPLTPTLSKTTFLSFPSFVIKVWLVSVKRIMCAPAKGPGSYREGGAFCFPFVSSLLAGMQTCSSHLDHKREAVCWVWRKETGPLVITAIPICAFIRLGNEHLPYLSLCYFVSLTALSFYPNEWTTMVGIQQIITSPSIYIHA